MLPYLRQEKLRQAIKNSIEATNPNKGLLKFHNDSTLPIDNIFYGVTLQRDGGKLQVLPDSIRGKFQ